MRKYFRRLLLLVFISLLTVPKMTNAWNAVGHVVVAEIAYENLTPAAKEKANQLAAIIFNRLPSSQQAKLDRQYPHASLFAKIAMLPDTWKKRELGQLFFYFHASLPLNLILSIKDTTADWHFINQPYPNSKKDFYIKSHNIVWALDKIKKDFSPQRSDATNAMFMVLTEHLIGDIYQPLHTMTHVAYGRQEDKGGNDFCLKRNRHGQCAINLHTVWDNAASYLKPKRDILLYAHALQADYPKAKFFPPYPLSFTQIATENYHYADFIYSISPDTKPSPDYYEKLQSIAKSQLAKAGYVLAEELNYDLAK